MKQTAIEQLIGITEQLITKCDETAADCEKLGMYTSVLTSVSMSNAYKILKSEMIDKLPIEKQNIVDARVTPPLLHDLQKEGYIKEAEDYYKTTFNK